MTETENKYNFPFELSEESIKAFEDFGAALAQAYELAREIFEKIAEAIKNIIDAIMPIIADIAERSIKLLKTMIETFPNKRVIHLATHGKRRTRKKNIARLLKWYARQVKEYTAFAQN